MKDQLGCGYIITAMNAECIRIADQLASTITGQAWYGDSLGQILNGVTAQQAESHPIAKAHSIWELLVHVEAWVKLCLGAIEGRPIPPWPAQPKELDWPLVTETTGDAWRQAGQSFFASHSKLVEAIKGFSDDRLEATVPGRAYNFYHLFQSATQHAIYHAGQIALLKKVV